MAGKDYDVVIVGTGCGAGPAAHALAGSGARVCMLERGPWRGSQAGRKPFASSIFDLSMEIRGMGLRLPGIKRYFPLFKTGILDFHVINGYTVVVASGVGGGSLVIGGFIDEPPSDIYDHYPPEISKEEMKKHFDAVAEVVEPAVAPKPTSYLERIDQACAGIPGLEARPQRTSMWYGDGPDVDQTRTNQFGMKQKNCNYQANCLTGCSRGAKNSMDITFLQTVLKQGGEIRDLAEARAVRKTAGGYTVDYRDLRDGSMKSITAPRVILSAGTMGTLKLLFASKANRADGLPLVSDRLGYRFGFNGDRAAFHLANFKVGHHYGPCLFRYQEIASDKHDFDFHMFACRFGPLGRQPLKWFTGDILGYLCLSREEPIGRIWPAGETFDVYYPSQDAHKRGASAEKKITMELNAIDQPLTDEKRRKKLEKIDKAMAFKFMVSVHPTGGAAMAESPGKGVVDHRGEVFGYPGLYVSDASLWPIASCCGPHFFIMAHSDRIGKMIALEEK